MLAGYDVEQQKVKAVGGEIQQDRGKEVEE